MALRPPTALAGRVFALLAAGYFVAFVSIAPWAGSPGTTQPGVVVMVASAIVLVNLACALLLTDWYCRTGRPALLILAAGSTFGAVMALAHAATYPGALLERPLFGSEQTVAWLYLAWRIGLAITYLAATLVEAAGVTARSPARRVGHAAAAHALALASCALAAVWASGFATIALAGERFSTVNHTLAWLAALLHFAALGLVLLKRFFNDTLYLWLSLVLAAAITDLVLSNLGGSRYTLGWHAARGSFVVSAFLLLVYLTKESAEQMPQALLPRVAAYAGALAAAFAAVFLRWAMHPWLGQSATYITLYGAVALSVWLGGWLPGTLCAVTGFAFVAVLLVEPVGSLVPRDVGAMLQIALYALSCAFIIGLGQGMRRASARYRGSESRLRDSERRLAAELSSMERLHGLSSRLLTTRDLESGLRDILDNAMASCEADFGAIQLYSRSAGGLQVAVQRGFGEPFLEHFRLVREDDRAAASARALRTQQRVVIEDVTRDAEHAVHVGLAQQAGYRALQVTPLRSHHGQVLGVLSTHHRSPHAVSTREAKLLDLYARHAVDLIERMRAEQALKAADRRKDEFLATLAHELRNPLAPIRNSLAIMGAVKPLPERLEKVRDVMSRQVRHLVRLVDDLLDASRITLRKVQLHKERTSLRALIHEAVESASTLVQGGRHQLHTVVPDDDPLEADVDATRIVQVLVNLLNNAAKFTPPGGMISLTAVREDDTAVITVRDTGAGIAPEHLETVFEMFSQPAPVLYRTEGGLGIGLAIVRGLVELHGGTVRALSAGLDKGSEFVVRLPLDPAGAPAAEQRPASASPGEPRRPRRILVVDDNADVVTTLRQYLEMHGHDVREAHDGVEGAHVAAEFRPDLVLLDIGMPRMNGYEAVAEIRKRLHGHPVRIVAITGWGQYDDKQRAFAAGFDLHMTKPVDPAAVAELL
ncbi:MAG: response regulator [Burkholderiaceae bacterium]|nr:response regulator [Burkholderiaceae bacterium]